MFGAAGHWLRGHHLVLEASPYITGATLHVDYGQIAAPGES